MNTMSADHLIKQTEAFHAYWKETNHLFLNACEGRISKTTFSRYLKNIQFLLHHTPLHLRMAIERSIELGDDRLTNFFQLKLAEEHGHEEWAKEDIATIAAKTLAPSMALHLDIVPGMLALVKFNELVIKNHPALYLPYILFAEYFVVIAAPEWIEILETRCAIPRQAASVLAKHAELDKFHVQDDIVEIGRFIEQRNDQAEQHLFVPMLERAQALFWQFTHEVGSMDLVQQPNPTAGGSLHVRSEPTLV